MKRSVPARAVWRLLYFLLLCAGPALLVACRDKAPTEAAHVLTGHTKNICWAPQGDCECWPPMVGTFPDCAMPVAPQVKIATDSVTLTQGDTTIFRVTAVGAMQWTVTGYSFVPVIDSEAMAMRGLTAQRALRTSRARNGVASPTRRLTTARQGPPGVATEGVRPVTAGRKVHFMDAAVECDGATTTICYDDPSQTGYEVVSAVVDGVEQRDSVLITVVPAPVPATIQINSVTGPNSGGSFTSLATENRLGFQASATGIGSSPQVRWEVANIATNGYALRLPESVTGELTGSLTIPSQDSGRYIGLPHPAPLTRTALRFIVTATAVGVQPPVVSAPWIMQQSERDALREEYVEYGIPLPNASWTKAEGEYAATTAFTFQVLNSGDYAVAVIDPLLPLKLDTIQRSAHRTLTITSGFRDPMHYRVHAHVRVRPLSLHQYGSAADIATSRNDDTWNWLRGKAALTGACIEPISVSTNTHLHVDYDRPTTTPCSPRWR